MMNNYQLNVESVMKFDAVNRHKAFHIFSKVQTEPKDTICWQRNFDYLDKQGLVKVIEKKNK
jgi:hypothetical protein